MIVTYFIQAAEGGPVKIGKSTESALAGRLKTLQCGNPSVLVLRGTVRGNHEEMFHARWLEHRLRGEWFVPLEAMRRYAADIKLEDERVGASETIARDRLIAEAWEAAHHDLLVNHLPDLLQQTGDAWRDLLADQMAAYREQANERDPALSSRLRFALSSHDPAGEE